MTYIENVYMCLAAPLIVAAVCAHRYSRRPLLFILSGMTACLFSSYISSFAAKAVGAAALDASLEISPLVEEVLKLTPLVFYMMVFEPERNEAAGGALMIAIGFATLENVCFLLNTDAGNTLHLMIRGFSTGAMHVVCGAMASVVLRGIRSGVLFRVIATLGLLCLSITCHGIYNVLVNQEGAAEVIGHLLPLVLGAATLAVRRKVYGIIGGMPPGQAAGTEKQ